MTGLYQVPKRSIAGDILLGLAVVAVGALITAAAYSHLGDKPHVLAQATQSPAPDTGRTPGETLRPTTPAPQPARPDADAQKAGAQPALPPAPAEKMGEPVPERK